MEVAGVERHRLQFVRDDGSSVIPEGMTLDKVKAEFADFTIEDRGAGRLSVKAGGLDWSFLRGESQPQYVEALWGTTWNVRNIDNGRELSLPCDLREVVSVLGRDCVATDSRGKVPLPK